MCVLLTSFTTVATPRLATSADDPVVLAAVTEAARQARELCFPRIHHDTVVFQDCLDDFAARPGTTRPQRLGVTYFAWVGAMNSARVGMQGAADTAARAMARLAGLQKRLKVSDAALCATIPGDCDVRLAQLAEQRKAKRPLPPKAEDTGHAH